MDGWIFLSGMMGAGKSTVARALGEALGCASIDLDERVARRAGRSVREIFADEGQEAFRMREVDEVERVLAEARGGIVSLGGGTVTHAATRRLLLRRGTLITLGASAGTLAKRLAGTVDRPLLQSGDAERVLEALLLERSTAYAECHACLETDARTPSEIAEQVRAVAERRPVAVPLGAATYTVDIGRGGLSRVPALVRETLGEVVVLVTDRNVDAPWARGIGDALGGDEAGIVRVVLEPGEEHKTVRAVERIWDAALAGGLDRRGGLLAIGGGVVGDLAGFAAATLLRGVAFAQVPTSLLAMVDASVGGKTGCDRPEGKNLVGAFHQPTFVVSDVDTLATLPDVELRAGLAEVVKAAWLSGEEAVATLERDAERLLARDAVALTAAIRAALQLKADVVADDEREGGVRRVLNLGHTVGHAIEAGRAFSGIRHGEAVAIGLVAAFRVAEALGDAEAGAHRARMVALLDRFGLPTAVDALRDRDAARFLAADKKRAGRDLAFVVPGAPGRVEIVPVAVAAVARAAGLASP